MCTYTQGHGLFPWLAAFALARLFISISMIMIVMRRGRFLKMIDGDGLRAAKYHGYDGYIRVKILAV